MFEERLSIYFFAGDFKGDNSHSYFKDKAWLGYDYNFIS